VGVVPPLPLSAGRPSVFLSEEAGFFRRRPPSRFRKPFGVVFPLSKRGGGFSPFIIRSVFLEIVRSYPYGGRFSFFFFFFFSVKQGRRGVLTGCSSPPFPSGSKAPEFVIFLLFSRLNPPFPLLFEWAHLQENLLCSVLRTKQPFLFLLAALFLPEGISPLFFFCEKGPQGSNPGWKSLPLPFLLR